MRRRHRSVEVWPAFSDLMSGVALLLALAWLGALQDQEKLEENLRNMHGDLKNVQKAKDLMDVEIEEVRRENEGLEGHLAEMRRLSLQDADKIEGHRRERVRNEQQAADLWQARREIASLNKQLDQEGRDPPEAEDPHTVSGPELELVNGLAKALMERGVNVERPDPSTGALVLEDELVLGLGHAQRPPAQAETADKVGNVVVSFLEGEASARIARIEVLGHADDVGTPDFNVQLSRRRATTLVDRWQSYIKESPNPRCILAKIFPVGVSNFRPKILDETKDVECNDDADNPSTAESESLGCRRNRRIEIRIVPKDPGREEVKGCP